MSIDQDTIETTTFAVRRVPVPRIVGLRSSDTFKGDKWTALKIQAATFGETNPPLRFRLRP